mmetsp:Transcript_624/g.1086  ORF Transcript_624/g.1086 Transcript_624/m.1086 type:complete len:102 (+) Transcript_624:206-511(+)
MTERRVKKQQVEALANKEIESIKKQLQADIFGTGVNSATSEEHKKMLKEETDKKLADLHKTADSQMETCMGLVLHYTTKVNPNATKENVQAYQQKQIASVA